MESPNPTIEIGGHLIIGNVLTDAAAFVPPPAELGYAGYRDLKCLECLAHRNLSMNGSLFQSLGAAWER